MFYLKCKLLEKQNIDVEECSTFDMDATPIFNLPDIVSVNGNSKNVFMQ